MHLPLPQMFRCKLAVSFREGVSMHLAKLCYFTDQWIYLKFSMSKFPGYPKSGPKIGGPKSKKSSTSDLNIFHTRFTRLKLPQLPGSTTDLPRGCLENDDFPSWIWFAKFSGGEYRQNQFKWKQTIGNLKLTASLQFTPENGCLKTSLSFWDGLFSGTAYITKPNQTLS